MHGCGWLHIPRIKTIKRKKKEREKEAFLGKANSG
jgi:hypothetical protein